MGDNQAVEPARALHSPTSETVEKQVEGKPTLSSALADWPKKTFLLELDYAVREQIKGQLHGQLASNMDHFVAKGLTFDQLKEVQKELDLCPSVLEFYPGQRNALVRWWAKFTYAFKKLFS